MVGWVGWVMVWVGGVGCGVGMCGGWRVGGVSRGVVMNSQVD